MKSEDDDRSVDWAPTQISELNDRLNKLSGRVVTLETAIGEPEGELDYDKEYETPPSILERLEGLSDRIDRLSKRRAESPKAIEDRMLRVEAWMAKVTGDEIRAAFERELGNEMDFSPPIGGTVRHSHGQHGPHDHIAPEYAAHQQPIVDEVRHGGLFSVEMQNKSANEAYLRGRAAVMESAERRVQAALIEMGWHENSPAMQKVMRALRNG